MRGIGYTLAFAIAPIAAVVVAWNATFAYTIGCLMAAKGLLGIAFLIACPFFYIKKKFGVIVGFNFACVIGVVFATYLVRSGILSLQVPGYVLLFFASCCIIGNIVDYSTEVRRPPTA